MILLSNMSNQHELIYWLGDGLMLGPNFKEVAEESCQNNSPNQKTIYKRNAALRMNWLYTIDKKPVYLNTGVAPLAKLIFSHPKEFDEYCNIHCYLIEKKNGLLLACNKYLKLDGKKKHFSHENYQKQRSGAKFFQWKIGISKVNRQSSITLCNITKKSAHEISPKKEKKKHSRGIQNLSSRPKKKVKTKATTSSTDVEGSGKHSLNNPSKSLTTENKDEALDSYSKWLIDVNKKPSLHSTDKNKNDEQPTPVYDDLDDLINKADDLELNNDQSNQTDEGSIPTNKKSVGEKDDDKIKKSPK